jgi:hypothetical protein
VSTTTVLGAVIILAAIVSTVGSAHRVMATSHLDQEIQGRLGQKLRTLYQELVNEPIPDRFVKLLNELEKRKG